MQNELDLKRFLVSVRGRPQAQVTRGVAYLGQIPSFKAEEPPSHMLCNVLEGPCYVKTHDQTQCDDNRLEYRLVVITQDSSLVKVYGKDKSH
jgi:hypothetical protein